MESTPPSAPSVETPRPPPEAPNTKHPTPLRHATPVRVLLVVMVVFVGLFLVLRTIAVEPFGVPTGSMAPALIGHHRDGPCPRCGYNVRVGRPTAGDVNRHYAGVVCQNFEYGREELQRVSLVGSSDLSVARL